MPHRGESRRNKEDVHIWLLPDDKAALEKLAEERDISFSSFCAGVLHDYIIGKPATQFMTKEDCSELMKNYINEDRIKQLFDQKFKEYEVTRDIWMAANAPKMIEQTIRAHPYNAEETKELIQQELGRALRDPGWTSVMEQHIKKVMDEYMRLARADVPEECIRAMMGERKEKD